MNSSVSEDLHCMGDTSKISQFKLFAFNTVSLL